MTTVRYAAIRCNGCGVESRVVRAQYSDDSGAIGLRRVLRRRGWRRVKGSRWYGRDYCGACAPQFPEAK